MKNIWQLQEAKAKFSEVVNEALRHGPQIITKHGVETALLISVNDYKKIIKKESKISQFFRNSPLSAIELDLSRSKDIPKDIEL
ncbi:type II toxin-antitoxin system Phd/YefM family antitoxin [bacterium]|nr:type II toxin-antitoxin system Phd/YefM family antitoxin [bacterium]